MWVLNLSHLIVGAYHTPWSSSRLYATSEADADPYTRLPELNVQSMCFLPEHRSASPVSPSEETYVLSMLYFDHRLARLVVSRVIDLSEKSISIEPYLRIDPIPVQAEADVIVAVPGSAASPGGLLVFGGGMCQFIETVAPVKAGKRRKSTNSKQEQPDKGETNRVLTTSIPLEQVAASVRLFYLGAILHSRVD